MDTYEQYKLRIIHEHRYKFCVKCLHYAHNPYECTHPARIDGNIDYGRVLQCIKLSEYCNPKEW